MAGCRIEIIPRPKQIGRDRRDEVIAVLPPVGLAQRHAGDFGHGIGLVGRLQRPSQQ